MDDVFVYYVAMPPHIKEFVSPCLDGYTVYINDQLSKEEQLSAYYHAMVHIVNHDFEKYDVQQLEMAAHYVNINYD